MTWEMEDEVTVSWIKRGCAATNNSDDIKFKEKTYDAGD